MFQDIEVEYVWKDSIMSSDRCLVLFVRFVCSPVVCDCGLHDRSSQLVKHRLYVLFVT